MMKDLMKTAAELALENALLKKKDDDSSSESSEEACSCSLGARLPHDDEYEGFAY